MSHHDDAQAKLIAMCLDPVALQGVRWYCAENNAARNPDLFGRALDNLPPFVLDLSHGAIPPHNLRRASMKPVHHATAKLAAKHGVTLVQDGEEWVAHLDGKDDLRGVDAKALVEQLTGRKPRAAKPKSAKTTTAGAKRKPAKKPAKRRAKAEGEEGEEEVASASVVKDKYKVEYERFDGTCGDKMAKAFAAACQSDGALDMDALKTIARDNDIKLSRWAHLNNGQQRMNLGNVLRGMIRRGTDVKVGAETFKGAKLPEKKAKAAKAAKAAKTA